MTLGLMPISVCSDSFEGRINHNFNILNAIHEKIAIDIVTELPNSPSEGDAYILKNELNNTYTVQIFNNGNWLTVAIDLGTIYRVQALQNFVSFDESGYSLLFKDVDLNIDALPVKTSPTGTNNFVLSDGDLKKINLDAIADYVLSKMSSGENIVPVGGLIFSASENVPPNCLLCDGQEVSRLMYASLFSEIGIAHGQGDGSATFNLPDYRGLGFRMLAGTSMLDPDKNSRTAMKAGGATGNSIGSVQGSLTKLPSSNFTGTTSEGGSHSHSYNRAPRNGRTTGIGGAVNNSGANNAYNMADGTNETTALSGSHSHTFIINNGGDAQTAMPNAYVNVFIRVV